MLILVLNGPNLNNLGKRNQKHYGSLTLEKINNLLKAEAEKLTPPYPPLRGGEVSVNPLREEGVSVNYLRVSVNYLRGGEVRKMREGKIRLKFFQSNHEGDLIDFLQANTKKADGILINPGALTHYGYSLYDALVDTKLPVVEVHSSDIKNRKELWRRKSVIESIVLKQFSGEQEKSYLGGLKYLIKTLCVRQAKPYLSSWLKSSQSKD